jgi:hypothetical protein
MALRLHGQRVEVREDQPDEEHDTAEQHHERRKAQHVQVRHHRHDGRQAREHDHRTM